MFATSDALQQHCAEVHPNVRTPRSARKAAKRKMDDDGVTPIIEAMPMDLAKKMRAVYDGPSRSLSVSQVKRRRRS
jgi:hypothetical protein